MELKKWSYSKVLIVFVLMAMSSLLILWNPALASGDDRGVIFPDRDNSSLSDTDAGNDAWGPGNGGGFLPGGNPNTNMPGPSSPPPGDPNADDTSLGDRILNGISNFWNDTREFASDAWDGLREVGSGSWDWMADMGETAWDWTRDRAVDVWDWTVDQATSAWEWLGDWGQDLVKTVLTIVGVGVGIVALVALGIISVPVAIVAGIGAAVFGIGYFIIYGGTDAFNWVHGLLWTTGGAILGGILQATGALAALGTLGKKAALSSWAWLRQSPQMIAGWVSRGGSWLAGASRAAGSWLAGSARAAGSWVAGTAKTLGSAALGAARTAGGWLAGAARASGGWLAGAARSIGSALAGAARGVGGWIARGLGKIPVLGSLFGKIGNVGLLKGMKMAMVKGAQLYGLGFATSLFVSLIKQAEALIGGQPLIPLSEMLIDANFAGVMSIATFGLLDKFKKASTAGKLGLMTLSGTLVGGAELLKEFVMTGNWEINSFIVGAVFGFVANPVVGLAKKAIVAKVTFGSQSQAKSLLPNVMLNWLEDKFKSPMKEDLHKQLKQNESDPFKDIMELEKEQGPKFKHDTGKYYV
ncbi:hypothetical protein [Alteribacter keqinensis]|uniref:Uncharacterized protein n=1 Tax=Alteribacter keqinensis TaxID=2483800 RepID=A0A3M7TPA2_9BACI|nr:hypothetical protein [Alteribacter keqinensis]RNA66847.1 hypothetical protein EBO34_16705 [Alteribacter keqinensis]